MAESNFKWWVLGTVIIGTFLGALNQSITNLALPKIIQAFGISVSTAGWIATAYIIANAVFVPVWGKLGDKIGRKKVYLAGFSIFIVGSILSGLSWNFSSMIVFRVIQAIASSADYPTAMAIIAVTFTQGRERAQALGIWSVAFALANVFGPLIGGPLIDNFGWRSVFFVNVPTGLIGILMAFIFIRESVSERKTFKFDWTGAITLGLALAALVLVLNKGMEWGWFSFYSLLSYCAVAFFGITFYLTEKKHEDPIIDLKFFKNSVFVWTIVNNFVTFMGMMGGIFLVPIFVQLFLGYSATQTGYMFIPMAVCMITFAQIGGRLVGRVKAKYVIFISTATAAFALVLFGYLIDPTATIWTIEIPICVLASGLGFAMAQRTSLITTAVPEHEVGSASSVLALARSIAGAFGIAIFTTILNNSINANVLSTAKHTIINTLTPYIHSEVAALIILKAEVVSYVTVFHVAAVIVFIGALCALFINPKHEPVGPSKNQAPTHT